MLPGSPSLAAGSALQLRAVGAYNDGSTAEVTSTVFWTSSSPEIATVSSGGAITGVAAGTASIAATSGSISGSANVAVTSASLVSISVSSFTLAMPQGVRQEFFAIGKYSDGTIQNLAKSATWSTSDPAKATVDARGIVTSVAAGAADIRAAASSVTGSAAVTVTTAILSSIAVTPDKPSMSVRTHQQFTATGNFSMEAREI